MMAMIIDDTRLLRASIAVSRHVREQSLEYVLFKHQHFEEFIVAKKVRKVIVLMSLAATSFSDCTLVLTPTVNDHELQGREMETNLKLNEPLASIQDTTKFLMRQSGYFSESEVFFAKVMCTKHGDEGPGLVELGRFVPGTRISELVPWQNFRRVRPRVE